MAYIPLISASGYFFFFFVSLSPLHFLSNFTQPACAIDRASYHSTFSQPYSSTSRSERLSFITFFPSCLFIVDSRVASSIIFFFFLPPDDDHDTSLTSIRYANVLYCTLCLPIHLSCLDNWVSIHNIRRSETKDIQFLRENVGTMTWVTVCKATPCKNESRQMSGAFTALRELSGPDTAVVFLGSQLTI